MIQLTGGKSRPSGNTDRQVTRDLGILGPPPGWTLRNWLTHRRREIPRNVAMLFLGHVPGIITVQSRLRGSVYRMPEDLPLDRLIKLKKLLEANIDVRELSRHFGGLVTDYGTLSTRVVTTVGVNFIVDAFQNLVELENLKFHGYGTGGAAEAVGNTALTTELTTEYATDNVRPTGTTTEGASANIYRTVATLSPNSGGTIPVTEHGVFDQAAVAGGTLLDRSLFSVVNIVASSDSLQTTYELTVTAGG